MHLRRVAFPAEPFPYIIWWICIIDIHALLSGNGKGTFVGSLMSSGQVPTLLEMGRGPSFAELDLRAPEEASLMPSSIECHQTISLLAARLGFLASGLRDTARTRSSSQQIAAVKASHVQQVQDLREILKQAWTKPVFEALGVHYQDGTLPVRVRGLFEHVGLHIPSTTADDLPRALTERLLR